jgi:hypothetical protein
MKDDHTN